jgi:hypothetical protein
MIAIDEVMVKTCGRDSTLQCHVIPVMSEKGTENGPEACPVLEAV